MKIAKKNPGRLSNKTEDDPRWKALVDRQISASDQFVYAVMTTGVYCKPCSPTKLPRPENVVFFDTAAQAEAAGYRPSKRADKDQISINQKHASMVSEVCREIDLSEELPNLNEMAMKAGISPFHFHRIFKKITGLTPKAYGLASRKNRVRNQLALATTVTDALYEAGYNSNSRFYEDAQNILGMKPTEYRAGGVNVSIKFALGECSLGSILVAQSDKGICAILLGDDPDKLIRDFQDQFPKANLIGGDADFEKLVAVVVGFVESPEIGLNLPLDLRGTVFQERVWQALREIPVGATVTYTELAKMIGMPNSVRAVANACGANKLAVAIPCHRVIRSDGSLSGYRWGVERKKKLLAKENSISTVTITGLAGSTDYITEGLNM
ncbi:Ada regulatory protein [Pseudomonas luteola]|uniref:methylated-DNA--[protein]-cysteine S-methyltransferase n=1 Tax=Pseudomonas luteola TaxID=47886 RepID=A0A2X2CBM9_PSELU|nr:bifunctional DNA-binding transcriptional regulator/O6-methylguanine-DNA methyltransferase Ada [Pseudomonas luteola]MCG7374134.1 bifunctional DNA-binding transcriptional regulator/O6-methylguanine-DNA methyltransferase Ada [Pseudomonas luteola]SPZ04878.1 Ada regulatory protein [Pseudomonas luteola]